MPAGRPTKYNDEILEKSNEYIKDYASLGDVMPTLVGLAAHLGVRRETVHAWAKDNNKEEFSNIYDIVMAKQHQVLVNKGLIGDFNPALTKLFLTKHGYSDKTEADINLNSVDLAEKTTEELIYFKEHGKFPSTTG